MAATYWSQLNTRTQLDGRSLKEVSIATGQLTHWALIVLLEDFLQGATAHAFVTGMED
jgi:hypothetical protein